MRAPRCFCVLLCGGTWMDCWSAGWMPTLRSDHLGRFLLFVTAAHRSVTAAHRSLKCPCLLSRPCFVPNVQYLRYVPSRTVTAPLELPYPSVGRPVGRLLVIIVVDDDSLSSGPAPPPCLPHHPPGPRPDAPLSVPLPAHPPSSNRPPHHTTRSLIYPVCV